MKLVRHAGWFVLALWLGAVAWATDAPLYDDDVAPILTKYCGGCHTEGEANSGLSMDDWESLLKGGDNGVVVVGGDADGSRLLGVVLGKLEPKMPPEGEAEPTEAEIDVLRRWIVGGAKGPDGDEPPSTATARRLPASERPEPVTSLAFSPDGQYLLAGDFGRVRMYRVQDRQVARSWEHSYGKVESVGFSADGKWVIAGTGRAGSTGLAILWEVESGEEIARFGGHRDTVYAAVLSHDAKLLATAGYDQKILLWDVQSPQEPRVVIAEHNGPVYELAFSPDDRNLVSASDDATLKVWRVHDGQRMDTRSEPLKEQYTAAIHPDGASFVGGGEDNRIRVWELVSREEAAINPIRYARFAHEAAIQVLRFSEDGALLMSVGRDRLVKLWETESFEQVYAWPEQEQHVFAAAISTQAGLVALAASDGQLIWLDLPRQDELRTPGKRGDAQVSQSYVSDESEIQEFTEQEPNDSPSEALMVAVPATIRGVMELAGDGSRDMDVDVVKFASRGGEKWMIEIAAARDKSPLDSHIEVLTADGERIVRVALQAMRDSYFTFRGKDSFQTGDFRLHNWEEMHLNQLLYCNGEVVKLYHYPRGPDSGFNVYPNFGNRHGMFDTTPAVHALQEVCYIVEPLAPGVEPVPNGLPVFPIYYENDDDAERERGADSRLMFTAPADGEYLVRVVDVRGQHGPDYHYALTIRRPNPRFTARLTEGKDPQIGPGRGRKFVIEVDREDGFDGEIHFTVQGLPTGLYSESPLTVEAGHLRAWGIVWAAPDAVPPADLDQEITLVPSARIGDRVVDGPAISLGKVQWDDKPQLRTELLGNGPQASTKDGIPVIDIVAGTTTTALIRIAREGLTGPVSYGNEDAAINAPHGVFVSNIGLNGVLLTETENERTIFLTAEPWVAPGERVMFLQAAQAGNATSNPVWLRIQEAKPKTADEMNP
jgi:WD40 repeat protein